MMVETPAKSQLPQNDTVRCGMEVRVVCVCVVLLLGFSLWKPSPLMDEDVFSDLA